MTGPRHVSAPAIVGTLPPPPPPFQGGASGPATAKDRVGYLYVPPKPKPSVLTKEERAALQKRIADTRLRRVDAARRDAASFCEYVLRDEASLREIRLAPAQERLQTFLDQNAQCVCWAHIEYGKSSLVSVGRVLWELGRNPNLRVAIVSETDGKAMKLLRGIKRYVQHSKELHEVFPHLVRSKRPDDPWNKHAITIQRESFARDPSIQVTGCGGSIIGSRVDLLVLDDILSDRTAITKNAQEKLLAWYNSNCAGRLTEHGRIFAVGTPWSTTDLYHHLAKTEGWVSKKFPVIDPETGLPTWPENWSLTRIAQARIRLGPLEAARQLDCEPASESTNRFQEAWITRALNDGGQCDFVQEWAELFPEDTPPHLQVLPDGCFTVTGVDVGASMRASGGLTVLTTLLVYPSGIRQILCIESGRWTGPEILRRCFDHHRRYRSTIFVETNAAQRFLLDFAEEIEGDIPPIRPHTTGRNKHDPTFGVESIGVEMFQGRWWFPNDPEDRNHLHPELDGLLAEMRKYTPDSHMGDRLSSQWIANMGAHTMRRGPPRGRARVRSFAPVDSARRDVDV